MLFGRQIRILIKLHMMIDLYRTLVHDFLETSPAINFRGNSENVEKRHIYLTMMSKVKFCSCIWIRITTNIEHVQSVDDLHIVKKIRSDPSNISIKTTDFHIDRKVTFIYDVIGKNISSRTGLCQILVDVEARDELFGSN